MSEDKDAIEQRFGAGGSFTRRKLLAALGVAGATIVAGSLLPSGAFAADEQGKGKGKEKGKANNHFDPNDPEVQVQLVDFGADGTVQADTAALIALAGYVNGFPNGTQPLGIVDGIPVRVEIDRASAPLKYTFNTGVRFTRPVEIVGSVSKALNYTGSGIMLAMGADDGRNSGNLFNDDHYILEGLHFTGGKNMTTGISFAPFTGLMARIKNCIFNQFGHPDSWAITFEAQNWWPEITGCRWESLDDLAKNFVKAIDDGRSGAYRGSGNSRLNFIDNKCKWHGVLVGGIGIYTNAVKTLISRSDFENAAVGVQLGYPSLMSEVVNCYFEQPLGGTSIRLGDPTPQPNNNILLINVKDIFVNLHNQGKFLDTANASVVASLNIDGVTLIMGGEQQPVFHLNDQPGQAVKVRNLTASYQPLLPVTSNPIHVIDVDGVHHKKVVNGALAVSQLGDNFTVPPSKLTPLADMWYVKTDFTACSASRVQLNNADLMRTRKSQYALRFAPGGTGSYKSVYFMVPALSEVAGHVCTVQLFARASSAANLRVVAQAAYSRSAIEPAEIKAENVALTSSFQEFTFPFWVGPHASLTEDSWFMLELRMPDSPAWYEFTGVRINQGDFGLCASNDDRTKGETLEIVQRYFERRAVVLSGTALSTVTVDMAPKAKALASAVMTFISPVQSPISGVEVHGGAKFSFGSPITNLDAVVDFNTKAFEF
ncbi:twin-arginine translocation signal domain-containing protein [Paenibacillus sp. GCM10027626]|uniref:twin-arginine translocation signal domain-containing protein n=1 Tax=Paenibacillus sp. GCM10027626 TaxID=3273411 RepID=UPI00362F637A